MTDVETCVRRRRGGVGTLYLLLPWLPVIAGCSSPEAPPEEIIRPVKTQVVTAGDDLHIRSFPGTVEAARRVELAFQVPGLLTRLPVKEGDRVAAGEIIAQLRQSEFEARLATLQGELDRARAELTALRMGEREEEQRRRDAQLRAAEARLVNSRADYERQTRLQEQRATTQVALDNAMTAYRVAQEDHQAALQLVAQSASGRAEDIQAGEAQVRGLEARVVEASLQLEDSTLRAPYDGVIAQRFVEEGQNIQAKQTVVRFQDVEEIEIAVDVPETVMAGEVRLADIVEITAEISGARGIQFPVQVREIAQVADPTTQTFNVRVAMAAPEQIRVLPGMTATVTLSYRRARILGDPILVPVTAVMKNPEGVQVAWVIDVEGIVSPRTVELGAATGRRVEVLSGLAPGDRIVVAGVPFLRSGMRVRDLGDALGDRQP